jgi:dolichol-phosphate mannosyltransferase
MNESFRPSPPLQNVGLPGDPGRRANYNERGDVIRLLRKLEVALAGIAWEAIFVDDNSPGGTSI